MEKRSKPPQERQYDAINEYHGKVPAKFFLICLLSCSAAAFSIGQLFRICLVPDVDFFVLEELSKFHEARQLQQADGRFANLVPTPKAKGGKHVPETVYTTKNFDTRRSATIVSRFLQPSEEGVAAGEEELVVPAPHNQKLTWNDTEVEHYSKDDEEHLPAGQHLLVDIDGLDASFLNSESRLATAMISLVDNSGLTLLSYHCHGLSPEGVSCAGVLLESHVAFHTWPSKGVITLDLFTCGSTSLLDSISLIEGLFVVPRPGTNEAPPTILWAYKRRGFNEQSGHVGSRDTFAYPLGIRGMEYKKEVASSETSTGKQARVYDTQMSRLTSITRQFYLDGVLKSNSFGQAAAHESFVHPAMLAHESPKRVLILGDGTGASIREVLKHPSVVEVTVLGSDETVIDFARKHLPEWHDCGGTSCFDDYRVRFVGDGKSPLEWVANHNGNLYDIVLVDLFDMDEEFASEISRRRELFLHQLSAIQTNDGVAAFNVAGSVRVVESQLKGGRAQNMRIIQTVLSDEMTNYGYINSYGYDETNVGFAEARHYVVAFKGQETSRNWFRNEAQVEYEIQKRFAMGSTMEIPFLLFDSANMVSYSKSSVGPAQAFEGVIQHARSLAVSSVDQRGVSRARDGDVKNEPTYSSFSDMEASESCSNKNRNLSEDGIASSPSWTDHDSPNRQYTTVQGS